MLSTDRIPCDGGYAIAAGLEQVIEYVREPALFSRTMWNICGVLNLFDDDFLDYLERFSFYR